MFGFHTHIVWINRSDGAENFTKRLCFRDVEDEAINKPGNSGITVDIHDNESIRPCCGIRNSVAGNSDLKNRNKICNADIYSCKSSESGCREISFLFSFSHATLLWLLLT